MSFGIKIQLLEIIDAGNHQVPFGDRSADGNAVQGVFSGFGGQVHRDGIAVALAVVHVAVAVINPVLLKNRQRGPVIQRTVKLAVQRGHHRNHQPFGIFREAAIHTGFQKFEPALGPQKASGQRGQRVGQIAVGLVKTFGNIAIDDITGDAFFIKIDQNPGRHFRGVFVGFKGACPQMREHDVRDIGHGFGPGLVFGIHIVEVAQMFLRLDGAEILFMEDFAAGAVNQRRAVLHPQKQFAVHDAFGGVVGRDVQGHIITDREQILETHQLNAQLFGAVGADHRIKTHHPHVEARQAADRQPADMPQTHHADGFAGDFPAHEFGFFPGAGTAGGVSGNQMARVRQHQRHHFLGHAVGIRAGGVHHIDAPLAGSLNINGVVSGAGPDDDFQFREKIENRFRDFFAADNKRVCVAVVFGEVLKGDAGKLMNFIPAMFLQKDSGDGIKLGGD